MVRMEYWKRGNVFGLSVGLIFTLIFANCASPAVTSWVEGAQGDLVFGVREVEVGETRQQRSHRVEFPFVVVGGEPVLISDLTASVGFTRAHIRADWDASFSGEYWPLSCEIPAGSKGVIVADFDSNHFVGSMQSTVAVRGNFASSEIQLKASAFVLEEFSNDPTTVNFGEPSMAELSQGPLRRVVRVVCREPFNILRWKDIPPGLRIEELGEAELLEDGRMARSFDVYLLHGFGEGPLHSDLKAETDVGVDLHLPVSANILGNIQYQPFRRMSFGLLPHGESRTRRLSIKSTSGTIPEPHFEILGEPAVIMTAQLVVIKPGREYQLTIQTDPTAAAGKYHGTLRITFPEDSALASKEFFVNARVRE